MPYDNKNKGSFDIYTSMDDCLKHNVEQNMPDTKEYMLYSPNYIKLKMGRNNYNERSQNNGYLLWRQWWEGYKRGFRDVEIVHILIWECLLYKISQSRKTYDVNSFVCRLHIDKILLNKQITACINNTIISKMLVIIKKLNFPY